MSKNTGLFKAKDAKKDEFYTTYEDIQAELNHYEKHFKDKTVLCNCDDPYESNFCKYFLKNFNYLGLKRLICTSYATSPIAAQQISFFDDVNSPQEIKYGYVMDIREVPMANGRGVSDADIHNLLTSGKRGVRRLLNNGDFRSEECIKYLKQADIVVTNPPFSLFREYVAQLIEYKKSFLIIGNVNAITYKEIFPLIKDNKLWLGASIHSGDRKFYVPQSYSLEAAGCGIDSDGRKYIRVKGVRWFTNLDYAMRHEELVLYKKYYGNEEAYPKYDNYDAINVDRTSDIPCDYFKDIGVPITYLDKHNPETFEIKKFRKGNDEKDLTYTVRAGKIATDRQTRLLPTSELSSSASCNGIMGVPITFLDKYNPEQFEILGIANSARYMGDYPCFTVIDGRKIYNRILIKRKQKNENRAEVDKN